MTFLGKSLRLPERLKAMPLTLWLAVAALIGPIITYGTMSVTKQVAIYRAVQLERTAMTNLCNSKLTAVATDVNAKADKTAAKAEEAERAVSPTPPDKEALKALCKSSSCREFKR